MCYVITATLVSFFSPSNTRINSSATGTMPRLRKGVYVVKFEPFINMQILTGLG